MCVRVCVFDVCVCMCVWRVRVCACEGVCEGVQGSRMSSMKLNVRLFSQ